MEVVASIPLSGCVVQILPKKETKKDFSLNISSPTKKLKSDLVISLETENEMQSWLKVIQDGIVLCTTHAFRSFDFLQLQLKYLE